MIDLRDHPDKTETKTGLKDTTVMTTRSVMTPEETMKKESHTVVIEAEEVASEEAIETEAVTEVAEVE